MAPLLKTTIQLLMGYEPTSIPQKPTQPCLHPQYGISKISGSSLQPISTISWGYNRLDVYAVDAASGDIAHKYWDGYQWGPSVEKFELLGGGFNKPPSAVSANTSLMDIFVAAEDGSLQHKYFDGTAWQPSSSDWEDLTGKVGADSAVSSTSWAPGRLDAFWVGADDGLHLKYYDGSTWGPSGGSDEPLGGQLDSGPAAVSWGPNRNDIFAISNSQLIHKYWDGNNWNDWETFKLDDEFPGSTPCAVSWGVNRLDIFLIVKSGKLGHIYWDGFQWSPLEYLGGENLVGTVAATASLNRLDIVAQGVGGNYYYKYFDGSSWQPSVDSWYDKGGSFASAPSVVSWIKDANQRFDIFGITPDGNLAHQTWYGSGWYPGPDSWETLGGGLAF